MADKLMSDVASDTVSMATEEQKTLDLVQQVLRSFQNDQSGMFFACGGTIPISIANNEAQQSPSTADGARTCQPVILHWDPNSTSVPAADCKLQFPLDYSDNKTLHNMQQLLHDMQPATFGYKGENVLDESYRKASKLDPSRFTCNFNPYELGIVDEVARIFLPGFKAQENSVEKIFCEPDTELIEPMKVLRADLYKLNVYTGPSGHFKAHVDTPRSTEQIGSLVVCLPCVHQGGQLEVRHEGRTLTFDWSMPETSRPEIQWAAFYSDCEHEVLEVTSGHRITLTYNLYASTVTETRQVGNGVVDPAQLPLYGTLHALFLQENFMPDGGYLGAYASHAYPHTSSSASLPSTLKGADMVVWETFRSLGCGVRLRPVAELPQWAHYGHLNEEPCHAADLTDTSSEGFHSHTDIDEEDHTHTDTDEVDSTQDGDGDRPMDDVDQDLSEMSRSSASGLGHSVPGTKDVPDTEYVLDTEDVTDTKDGDVPTPGEEGDGDQTMAETPSTLPIGPERWEIDPDEVQALQQEAKELESLPTSEFKGLEPAGLLVPRHGEDKNETATTAKFEQIGQQSGCRVVGNGLSFYPTSCLIEEDEQLDRMMYHWIKQKPHRQELTAEQPRRVGYGEVAWLNHSGISKEPQMSYGIVSHPRKVFFPF